MKQNMLKLLNDLEKRIPELLKDESMWQGLFVDYHAPFVERLWTQAEENRISLHKIYPCENGEALFHPHPWPQACKILKGSYEMSVGYGEDHSSPPPYAVTLVMAEGATYEMIDPNGWHYVRPLGEPTLSIMVTGKPWSVEKKTDKNVELKPLSENQRTTLFNEFRKIYPS